MTGPIGRFLKPTSAAVIGASRRQDGPSDFLVRAIIEYGQPSELHLVNPGGHEIAGRSSVRSVEELPDGVDLSLVMVPAPSVVAVVEACAAKGFGGAIVYSAGFSDDHDEQGPAREAELARIAARTGMRILGPNSQGFLNLTDNVVTSFSPTVFPAALRAALGRDDLSGACGGVAIIAQSGGLGFSLLGRGLMRGVGFSHVISTGNEVDLELQDFLEFLIDDPRTDVVVMYIEGLKAPERFQAIAERAQSQGTKLVAAKVGASSAGQRAALSHTGHIAGDNGAYHAVFRRYGIEVARDPDEMLDLALALSSRRSSRGPRVAVVSASGGSAVWLADALSDEGLELPTFSDPVAECLQKMLPSFASTANPIDISGGASVGVAEVLAAVADDPGVDALLLSTTLGRAQRFEDDRDVLTALAARTDKPTVVYSYTEPHAVARDGLRELRIPLYSGIRSCVRGLGALARSGQSRSEPRDPDGGARVAAARAAIERCEAGVLCEYETKTALGAFGLEVAQEVLATNVEEAIAAAEKLGYPVAVKIQSPDIPHKATAGGVVLGCANPEAVADAYRRVVDRHRGRPVSARIHGVLIQLMAPPGFDLLLGVQNRSGLGAMVVLGIGGDLVEVIDRTVSYPAPFGLETAQLLAAEVGLRHVIDDLNPLALLLSRLSRFAAATADLVDEMDLNPVVVEREGGRLHLIDALLVRSRP